MDIGDTVFIHMIDNVGKLVGVRKSLAGMPAQGRACPKSTTWIKRLPIMRQVVAEAKIVEKIDSGTYMVDPVGDGHNTPWERTEDKWWFTRSGAQLALEATNRERVL